VTCHFVGTTTVITGNRVKLKEGHTPEAVQAGCSSPWHSSLSPYYCCNAQQASVPLYAAHYKSLIWFDLIWLSSLFVRDHLPQNCWTDLVKICTGRRCLSRHCVSHFGGDIPWVSKCQTQRARGSEFGLLWKLFDHDYLENSKS